MGLQVLIKKGGWDVSNVENMSNMFNETSFNQNIEKKSVMLLI